MSQSSVVGAVVLCGGLSSRMGSPKALLPFGPEVMLRRVMRVVREAVTGPIVVVAAVGQKLPSLPAEVVVTFDEHEARGPLQGLHAGLTYLLERCETALVAGCDHPFLQPSFLRRVCDRLADGDAAVPLIAGRLHPLTAVYRPRPCVPQIAKLLAADRLRVTDLFALVNTRLIDEASLREVDPDLKSVRNMNTPDEYQAALREAGYA
jgi:molybdopterin-guanine dinucleotide biosynthesis protein A